MDAPSAEMRIVRNGHSISVGRRSDTWRFILGRHVTPSGHANFLRDTRSGPPYKPETLVCDRGSDLTSKAFEDAAFQLGIHLDFNPPRTPHSARRGSPDPAETSDREVSTIVDLETFGHTSGSVGRPATTIRRAK